MEKKDKTLNVPHLRFPEFSGEWEMASIAECFSLYSGNTPSRTQKDNFVGELNWISSGELKTHYLDYTGEHISLKVAHENNLRILPVGTFVIAIYGLEAEGVRGTGSIITKESTISQACMAFLPKGPITSEFLYAWYKKHGNLIGIKYAQGTKQQNLGYEIVEKLQLRFPSIAEQKKLELFISLIDQRIETQKKIIEDLKKLKAAICIFKLKSHCEKEYTIRELCQSITAKQYIANEITSEGAYPIIQQGENSIAGYTDSLPFLNYKKVILLGDHTLSIYRPETPFLIATDGIKILKPNEKVIRDYFYYLLYTFMPEPEGYKRHYSILKDIIVPIPNIKMQESIVDKLLSIDSKLEIEERILELQIQQKQYLLNRLFI